MSDISTTEDVVETETENPETQEQSDIRFGDDVVYEVETGDGEADSEQS